jgi:hypothetical protein
MVASQIVQKSSTGIWAQRASRSRRGTGTRSRLHGWLRLMKSESALASAVPDHGSGLPIRRDLPML